MIRPLTIATCLLACGSGLYLYQSKHEVQLLDRTIERTVRDTNTLREQSRLVAAEWTMLNDPERLRQFSDTYLNLRTITPSQFTSIADLNNRLPAPDAEQSPRGTDDEELAPVAVATPPSNTLDAASPATVAPATVATDTAASPAAADEVLPVPPIPTMRSAPAVASVARPAEIRTADRVPAFRPAADTQARSVATADARGFDQRASDQRGSDQRGSDQRAFDQRASDQRASDQRVVDQRGVDQRVADQRGVDQRVVDQRGAEPRVAPRVAEARMDLRSPAVPPPRPIVLGGVRPPLQASGPVNTAQMPAPSRSAMVATAAPYSGSLLGMARGTTPPAPRPTPVNATYNSN
jgi:hypothetical protein